MNYAQTIQDKRTAAASKAGAQQTIDSLINQLKEVQLASLMGGSKQTVVLADSTDFGEKMAELGEKIETILTEFKNDTKNADKLAEIAAEYQKLAVYNVKSAKEQADKFKQVFDSLIKAVEAIKLPEIPKVIIPEFPKIPAPVVNVPKTDLSPIQRAIEGLKEEKGLDLDDFKAHDIYNAGDTQYIGFLAPSGQWYIIENKVKENSLRYVFGKDKYKDHFKKAATYEYSLLSEAINAL